MKCLYYLAPTLNSTETIADDLQSMRIKDWYVHVMSKDEAGLERRHIRSANYVELRDFMARGMFGAAIGFVAGFVLAVVLGSIEALEQHMSLAAFIVVIIFGTLFGAWVGGLNGLRKENTKLSPFRKEIEAGKYLFLIYTPEADIDTVKEMMRTTHPESKHVGTDEHFTDPFEEVETKV